MDLVFNTPVIHHQNLVGISFGELRVVSYQHKCRVRGSSGLLQQIHDLFGVLRIQIAGWLVCKK